MLALVVTIITLNTTRVFAQPETPKFELGAQFSLWNANRVSGHQVEPGFGGRFGYNVHKNLAVEAEINFFPRGSGLFGSNFFDGGRITQGLFGVKAGKRFERFGLFGKVRPGFVSFGNVLLNHDFSTFDVFRFGRLTHPALDLGGVVEVYPSSRTLVRFDLGDTIIHYGKQDFILPSGTPFTFDSFTRHSVQFSVGFSFRF